LAKNNTKPISDVINPLSVWLGYFNDISIATSTRRSCYRYRNAKSTAHPSCL